VTSVPTQINGDALTLQIRLSDRGGGIGEVRVFINGTAVSETGGRALRAEVAGLVPRRVFSKFLRFTCCPGCGRIYRRGTHFQRLERLSRRRRFARASGCA